MDFQEKILDALRKKIISEGLKNLLLIDGDDSRAQAVARKIQEQQLAKVALLVDVLPKEPPKDLEFVALDSQNVLTEKLVELYLEIRKGKETKEQAEIAVKQRPVVAALLLKMGHFQGVVGGLALPTADILRAGFRIIGPKPGSKTISSCMLMVKEQELYVFSDISVIPTPNPQQLAEIAQNAVEFAEILSIEPKVAFLSFSTYGSAKVPATIAVSEAHQIFLDTVKGRVPSVGEVQFDAAFDPQIRQAKCKDNAFSGAANVYIFPDLNSGNIGYKIAQRLGGFLAVGPVVTGLSLPFNDLSRGATVEDVYFTSLLTILASYSLVSNE